MAALTTNLVRLSRNHVAPLSGVVCISRHHKSTNVVRDQYSNTAAYQRGRGGRSSFSGQVVTVLGATGFVGKYVVNRLGKIGSQVIIPYRGDSYFTRDLKLAGDLGQILFVPYHLNDEESLRKCMQYSNVVVNLIGRDWETRNFNFNQVHASGAEKIARIAKEVGVEKLIHLSHLNAQPTPPEILVKGGSKYLKSKYYSELEVRDAFPEATILKPADIFGLEDRFVRYYASAWRRAHGRIPLWKKGEQTIKMPVFVSDVAEGILNAIYDPEAVGKTYECVGPHSYYLSDIVDYMYRCMRWNNAKRTYITPIFKMKVNYMSYAPNTPLLNMDRLSSEHVSDKTSHLPTLEDLGVSLTKFDERTRFILKPYRRDLYYDEAMGEFADPDPLPALA